MNDLVMQSSYKKKLFYAFLKLFYTQKFTQNLIKSLKLIYLN